MVKTFHDRTPKPAPPDSSAETPGSPLFASLEARKLSAAADSATTAPKPLFRPAVHAELAAGERARIEQAIAGLKLDDFRFGDAEISRIIQLRDDIRVDDPTYISEFGADLGQFSDGILNRLAEISQSRYPEQIREYLTGILQQTRKVNPEALRESGNAGWLKSLFTRGVTDKEGFRQVEREIGSLTASCLEKLSLLKKSQLAFVDLLEKTELQFRTITCQMVAGQLRLAAEREEADAAPPGDFFARQEAVDRQEALNRFERRLHNLSLLRHTVLLRMSQLRLEQKNIHALIDQTHETITLVIPAWRQQVMALFSASAGEMHAELFDRLATTQHALQERLQAINTRQG
ncbi:MAG: toxic anion resistance protein [Fluviicoccus sp.]|uniref:toxic anion resistance protein n=1 Tax=Fluviicoccus sp. TaxID=2003552 RepID=UPI002715F02E|nr:toxic anion resistance protein [Fluviicoccus sp.]MDO8329427.1 toxic anion resistance protein [Fluviicoccus sp.]